MESLGRMHFIQNREALATTQLRRDALDILESGYHAVHTNTVMHEHVALEGDDICFGKERVCLTDYNRVLVVAVGKCAVDAAGALEEILGNKISDGVVLDVKHGIFKRMRSFAGSHPFPSDENISATQVIVNMLKGLTDRDLVLVVVSGGGSSLLCLPHDIECDALEAITKQLWRHGATIQEVNVVRKHLSDIQGGQLAKAAYPAHILSFIFSDVPGDDISVIASGPTVLDTTTVYDATAVINKYNLATSGQLPQYTFVETPKEHKYFEHVKNILVATNHIALQTMLQTAKDKGYDARVVSYAISGEARTLGEEMAQMELPPKTCLLYGGETTVHVTGSGRGGRNQELALGAARVIGDNRVVLAAASDGWDNTEVAGAIADAGDRKRAEYAALSIEHCLQTNDAFNFWKICGGAIHTGKTGINVADFYMVLTE